MQIRWAAIGRRWPRPGRGRAHALWGLAQVLAPTLRVWSELVSESAACRSTHTQKTALRCSDRSFCCPHPDCTRYEHKHVFHSNFDCRRRGSEPGAQRGPLAVPRSAPRAGHVTNERVRGKWLCVISRAFRCEETRRSARGQQLSSVGYWEDFRLIFEARRHSQYSLCKFIALLQRANWICDAERLLEWLCFFLEFPPQTSCSKKLLSRPRAQSSK